jgi:hypothetical protein
VIAVAVAAAAAAATGGGTLAGELAKNGPWGLALLGAGGLAYRLILRETARADRAEAELRDLNKDLRDRVVPLLTRLAEDRDRDTSRDRRGR